MKLFSTSTEMKALYGICSNKSKYSAMMLGALSEDHFYSDHTREAISRVKKLAKSSGELPTYDDICIDPVISESTRKILSKYKGKSIKKREDAKRLIKHLTTYYKARKLYFLSEKINERLMEDKLDPDELLEQCALEITQARVRTDAEQPIFHLGRNNNSVSLVKELLNDEKPDLLPTGFRDFDDVNGGILFGSLMLVGGTTGGGKSSLAIQLLKNFCSIGLADVAMVPLEMTEKETLARLMSNISGVPLAKILQKKMTKNEKKAVAKAYKKFYKENKKNGVNFTIFAPEEDMTAEDIFLSLEAYDHRVILIDYISLLKGVDGDDSWKQLGSVARMAKVYAKNRNKIVVLLVQISKEGEIRYSKAVEEHANNSFFFVANKESREAGILNITQTKARNQAMFDFQLAFNPEIMRITDISEADMSSMSDDKEELSEMN